MATFKGRITWLSEVQSGTSKAGKGWSKQTAVLTYDSSKPEWPKAIVVSFMNDNITKFGLTLNECYEMEVDFQAREYNGRYYMEAAAWKCAPLQQAQAPQPYQLPNPPYPVAQPYCGPTPTPAPTPTAATDDLPF